MGSLFECDALSFAQGFVRSRVDGNRFTGLPAGLSKQVRFDETLEKKLSGWMDGWTAGWDRLEFGVAAVGNRGGGGRDVGILTKSQSHRKYL